MFLPILSLAYGGQSELPLFALYTFQFRAPILASYWQLFPELESNINCLLHVPGPIYPRLWSSIPFSNLVKLYFSFSFFLECFLNSRFDPIASLDLVSLHIISHALLPHFLCPLTLTVTVRRLLVAWQFFNKHPNLLQINHITLCLAALTASTFEEAKVLWSDVCVTSGDVRLLTTLPCSYMKNIKTLLYAANLSCIVMTDATIAEQLDLCERKDNGIATFMESFMLEALAAKRRNCECRITTQLSISASGLNFVLNTVFNTFTLCSIDVPPYHQCCFSGLRTFRAVLSSSLAIVSHCGNDI